MGGAVALRGSASVSPGRTRGAVTLRRLLASVSPPSQGGVRGGSIINPKS